MNSTTTDRHDDIIVLDKFIQATRDSGYKDTASAVSELVDNSLQANAKTIEITISSADDDNLMVTIQDDGHGMDAETLRLSLRFGGTTRFNSREGLGRYGMGLPNSSLSQARRVTVYTWKNPDDVSSCYLDVDEISQGKLKAIPRALVANWPTRSKSGTAVVWTKCDKLDNRRISTMVAKLKATLGRRFRYYLWRGKRIVINGEVAVAVDPLYLNADSKISGASAFGEPLRYKISANPDDPKSPSGVVEVTFSELPVSEWHSMSNEEKRRIGVSKGAGVSVVRAEREVDYGWFFMPGKRRENYDDWWRCEIRFDPVLDEAFGITHTKQQIRPKAYLIETLADDIESAARSLNARARKAHLRAKTNDEPSKAELIAGQAEDALPTLPTRVPKEQRERFEELKRRHPELKATGPDIQKFSIIESRSTTTTFFDLARNGDRFVLSLDPHHPFYKRVYKPLLDSESPRDQELRTCLELLLIAAARAEASDSADIGSKALARQRLSWSNVLSTLLGE